MITVTDSRTREIKVWVPAAGEAIIYVMKVPDRQRFQAFMDASEEERRTKAVKKDGEVIMQVADIDMFNDLLVEVKNLQHPDGKPVTPDEATADESIVPLSHKTKAVTDICNYGAFIKAEEVGVAEK